MLVSRLHRSLALAWLVLVGAAFAVTFVLESGHPKLRTSVLEFLPEATYPQQIQPIVDQLSRQASRQLFVLLTAKSSAQLVAGADELSRLLPAQQNWALVDAMRNPHDMQQIWAWWRSFSGYLLRPEDQQLLQHKQYGELLRNITLRYMSPIAAPLALAERDPLFFLQNYLVAQSGAFNIHAIDSGWPIMQQSDSFATILVFETRLDVFDMELNQALVQAYTRARQQLQASHAELSVQATGAVLHVNSGVTQAKREILMVGGGSLLAILGLFMWAFRSLKPFLLSVVALTTGLLLAFALSIMIFGSVHIMSFVFCSSVLGLGVDYSLHYFAHRQPHATQMQTLQKIVTPTGLGMASSVAAFVILAIVPFPGFRQMAVLTALGLLMVWITLLLWYPYLDRKAQSLPEPRIPVWLAVLAGGVARLLRLKALAWVVITALLAALVVAALQVRTDDDLRNLQAPVAALSEAEDSLAQWLGWRADTAYFLVHSQDRESALQTVEELCASLRQLPGEVLDKARCLTDWLPSQRTQQLNHRLLSELAAEDGVLWPELEALGLSGTVLADYRRQLATPSGALTAAAFWQGPVARNLSMLWLEQSAKQSQVAVVVPLSGVGDRQAVARLADAKRGIAWIDPVGSLSAGIKEFRQYGAWYVLAGYAVIALLMTLRYGIKNAFFAYLPILFGLLAVLAAAGMGWVAFNVFTVLALILVVGMGVDYGLFFLESTGKDARTLLAVLISGITTLLAFGLLALSQTTAISSFGSAILVGMSVVLLGSLIIEVLKKSKV